MIVYAASADLTGATPPWLTSVPSNVDTLLRAASLRVAEACQLSPYDAPAAGAVTPLRDATCAQVASWVALGVDPAKGGTDLPGPVRRSKILTGEVERDTTAATKLAEATVDGLCAEAVAILQLAGLLYQPGPLFDDTGCLPTWGLDVRYPFGGPLFSDVGGWPFW